MSAPTAFDPKDTPMPMPHLRRKYQFSRTTGWRYERAGLQVIRVGSKVFCRESDFVAFLERKSGQTTAKSQTQEPPQ